MIITEKWLRDNLTAGCGIKFRRQLEILGESGWTPGWVQRAIGKELTDEQADLFASLAGTRKNRKKGKRLVGSQASTVVSKYFCPYCRQPIVIELKRLLTP